MLSLYSLTDSVLVFISGSVCPKFSFNSSISSENPVLDDSFSGAVLEGAFSELNATHNSHSHQTNTETSTQ